MTKKSSAKFNPVKEEKSSRASKVVWSTEVLDIATKALDEGKRLKANPFYEGNTKILKGDLVFERTPYELAEWRKCKEDIIYFVNKYCKLMTPEGIKRVILRDYQEEYLKHLETTRLSIFLSARQSGKTTTTALELLHYVCFNVDKTSMVLGNKRKTAIEILTKLKDIFVELPFFLRPGVYKWNEGEIVFDNGCRCQAEATTLNSAIGFTCHFLLLDEFAHINPNIKESFYNNIFPTVSASRAKVRITSTQNGYDLFYRLYQGAVAGENEYKPFKVDWWQVPEWNPIERKWYKRDEAWKIKQIANLGGEEAFNSQFGTSFDISANTLINRRKLGETEKETVQFVNKDLPGVPNSDSWFWHPSVDPMDLKKECIIITGDLAEGLDQDYTAFSVWRLDRDGEECIGFFRSKTLSRSATVLSLLHFLCRWTDLNKTLISHEANTYGDIFLSDLEKITENDPQTFINWDPSALVKYYNESGTKWKNGIKITPGNKTPHCILFKESFERGKTRNSSEVFHNELLNFTDNGSGRYAAGYGHDDLVMTAVQLEFVKQTLQYKHLRDRVGEPGESPDSTLWNPYERPFGLYNSNLDPFSTKNRLR